MAKEWTPEERKAFGEKMKAAKAAKKPQTKTTQKQNETNTNPVQPESSTEVPTKKDNQEILIEQLIKMVDALQQQRTQPTGTAANMSGLGLNQAGQITGVITKYPLDKDYYPDPCEELANMPELVRFGFKENYDLKWDIHTQPYQTNTNIWYNEPWHIVTLYKRLFDDDGNPVMEKDENGNLDEVVYIKNTGYFFEDDMAVQQEAQRLGLTEFDSSELSNILRLERMKTWLKNIFYPPKPKSQYNDKQVVVNGQVVIQTSRTKVLDHLPSKDQIRI